MNWKDIMTWNKEALNLNSVAGATALLILANLSDFMTKAKESQYM